MRSVTKRLASIAALAVLAAACSKDSSGPSGTTLSAQQKSVITNALTNLDASTGAGVGVYGAVALQFLNQVGSLGAGSAAAVNAAISASLNGIRATTYEGAVGIQIVINDQTTPANSGTFTAVIGWDGLNTSAQTVNEIVFAGVAADGATPPSSGTYSFASTSSPFGLGLYFNRTTGSFYEATTGGFTLSSASFSGGGTSCSQQGVTCNYVTGSMGGSMQFGASLVDGTGPATYTQSTVTFASLPAVRITLSGIL